MVMAQVTLTDEEAERLEELARDKRVSLDDVIHDMVVEQLSRASELTMAEKRRRSLEVLGKYRSGVTDLAENHDKYLAEAYES